MAKARFILLLAVMFLAVGCAGRDVTPVAEVTTSTATTPTQTDTPVSLTGTPTLIPTDTSPLAIPTVSTLEIPVPIETILQTNAEQVELLARLGDGSVELLTPTLVWSPDGDLLALGTSIGVYLYAPDTMEELMFLETGEPVTGLVFSPDGEVLAAGQKFGGIRLWYVADGELLQDLSGHKEWVRRLVFAPAGDMLASSAKDGSVYLWGVPDGELLHVIESDRCSGGHCVGYGIDISPDGQVLAVGTEDGYVQLWRVSDGELLRSFKKEPEDSIGSIAFSPDGELIAANSWKHDSGIHFWRVSDGELLQTTERSWEGKIITFSPDGKVVALVSPYGTVDFWQVSDGEELPYSLNMRLTSDWCPNHIVDFGKDGALLSAVYCVDTRTVSSWRVPNDIDPEEFPKRGISNYTALTWPMMSMALSPDDALFASGMGLGNLYLWRASDGSIVNTIVTNPRNAGVTGVDFSPDGELLVASTLDGNIKLWRLSDMALMDTFEDPSTNVIPYNHGVTFSPDGRLVVSGEGEMDGTITFWDVSTGEKFYTLDAGGKGSYSWAFHPDGEMFALGTSLDESESLDGNTITLRNISDGSQIRTIADDLKGVRDLAFSPDGRLLAAGVGDKIRLWGVSDGELLLTIEAGGEAYSLAFSPGGEILAAGVGRDVVLWRVPDGELLRVLEGHKDAVVGVAFGEDGRLLVSGSYDGTLRLWGLVE